MGDLGVGLRSASIVIPAHDEEHALPRVLGALLDQELDGMTLEVVVVVNGTTDGSAAAARSFLDRFDRSGHHLSVIEIPIASKAWALNEGDRRVSAFPRLYLDADIELSPNAVRRTVEELSAVSTPMLAAPRIQVAESRARAPRCYGRMWSQLPYVRSHVPGVGFYAVNEAGRQRWWRFPVRIGADDKFVRLHFDHSEARVIDDASFTVYMPERLGELLKVRGRWTSTNREIARSCPGLDRRDTSRWMSSARHLACNSSTWTDAPYFLGVWSGAWGWALLRTMGVGDRWPRAASSPMRAAQPNGTASPSATAPDRAAVTADMSHEPRSVHVAVVTHNSVAGLLRCIDGLLASEALDDLRITVVDNASTDGGPRAWASMFPNVEVIANEVNVGFGAAVNQAFAGSDSRWLAIVNPDVEVRRETLSATIAHLERRPGVGSCGVPSVHSDGSVNDRSFFMRPTIWSEITLAFAAHRVAPTSRLLNPEQNVAHVPLTDTPLGVDVIAGCFNVIDRELFEHLDGYDEDFFLCGEDFDLSIRAVEAGASPEVVPVDPIVHHSEGSFTSSSDARVAYLRGRARVSAALVAGAPSGARPVGPLGIDPRPVVCVPGTSLEAVPRDRPALGPPRRVVHAHGRQVARTRVHRKGYVAIPLGADAAGRSAVLS